MQSDIPQAVFYEAAEWYATLFADDCTESERHAWQRWLSSHPLHQQAWQRVEQIHAQFHAVDKRVAVSVLNRQGNARRQLLKLLVLGVLLGGSAYSVPWQTYAADYRTAKGESGHWTLSDSVTLYLNTDSAVTRLDASTSPLALRLLTGECLLDSQSHQPLRLSTPHGDISLASPCRVDVLSKGEHSILAVFAGEALIGAAARPQERLRVTAGQQVMFSATGVETPTRVEDYRQSWLDGVLLADNMRLDSLINEFARYHHGYFSLDEQVASLRISGAFPMQDNDRFFNALARTLPIRIERRFSWWIRLRSR